MRFCLNRKLSPWIQDGARPSSAATDALLRLSDTEIADDRARGLLRRQLEVVLARDRLRMRRLDPGDLNAVTAEIRRWRPVAVLARTLGCSGVRT